MLSDKLNEFAKTLFIIDKPMSRLPYFKMNIIMVIFALLFFYSILIGTTALPDAEIFKVFSYASLLFLFLFILVITIVLMAKRLWDILGKKKPAIICAFIIGLIILPLSKVYSDFKIAQFIISLVLLFTKGKKQESIQSEENKEEVSKEG